MDSFYGDNPETLFIAPNCGLEIELDSTEYNKEFGIEYQVLNINAFPLIDNHPSVIKGWLSPTREVTLPKDAKVKAGVPIRAKRFAYLYPPRGLAEYIDWEKVMPTKTELSRSTINIKTQSFRDSVTTTTWALPYVASFGGYVYFDEDLNLLGVNAISFNETPYIINFAGPFVATKNSYRDITGLNRYQALYLDVFREVDYIGCAWIDPGDYSFIDTEVEGQSHLHVQNHHGGFLYFRHDKTAVLFLVEVVFPMDTPSHGVGSLIIDAFRLCKFDLKTASTLCVTCPSLTEQVDDMQIHRAAKVGSKERIHHYVKHNQGSGLKLHAENNLFLLQDSFGWTPLHHACCYHAHDYELISMIIAHCPQAVLKPNKNNLYPIHLACHHSTSAKVIEILLQHDPNYNTLELASKHHGFLPLHFACSNSQTPLEVIQTLILHDNKTVSVESTIGCTSLHMAIASNHSHQVIDILLCYGSESQTLSMGKTNPVLLEKVNGMLPIHLACLKGCSVDIVSLLLKADVEDKCFYSIVEECKEYDLINSTILHIALAHSPVDVIKLLIAKEVKARCISGGFTKNLLTTAQSSRGGMFPIHVACARKDLGVDIIRQLLLLEMESISYVDSTGNTPLHHVCNNENANENLVELLLKTEDAYFLKQGKSGQLDQLSVKKSNTKGETPLHLAVKAKATGTHALLQPKYICLKGLEGEGKDKLVELVLANKSVQKILLYNLAQRPYFALIMLELVANIFATIIYFDASIATVNGVRAIRTVESVALITCSVIFILRELIQLKSTTLSDYFSNGLNWIQCASIAALLTATVHLIQLRGSFRGSTYGEHGEYGEPETRLLFTWSGALLLLQFIFIVRTTFLPFAGFMAGLLAVLIKLIPAVILSVMLLIIFTYSYVISGRRTKECPDFSVCFLWTMEGYFYGMDGFAVDPVLDILFGLIAVVILLNLVIAVLSTAWDDSSDDAREVFWQSRVEFLFQYSFFNRLFCADSRSQAFFESVFDQRGTANDISEKKSSLEIVVSFATNVIWFALGLVTFGLLGPYELRHRILATGTGQ